MAEMKGTVKAVSTKFGKFSIQLEEDTNTWYSTKEEWAPTPRPQRGDMVEFDNKGAKFLNKCKIVGSGGGSASSAPKAAGKAGGYRQAGTEGGFPIHPLAYERALDRRNALQCATNLAIADFNKSGEEAVLDSEYIIKLAATFEHYTTGGLDAELAEEMEKYGEQS